MLLSTIDKHRGFSYVAGTLRVPSAGTTRNGCRPRATVTARGACLLHGFTLVESLALATLLGFATVAIAPQVTSLPEWSRNKLVKQHIAQLNELAERRFVDTGVWPVDLAELVADGYLVAIPNHPDSSKRYQLGANYRVEVVRGSCESIPHVRMDDQSRVGLLP